MGIAFQSSPQNRQPNPCKHARLSIEASGLNSELEFPLQILLVGGAILIVRSHSSLHTLDSGSTAIEHFAAEPQVIEDNQGWSEREIRRQ